MNRRRTIDPVTRVNRTTSVLRIEEIARLGWPKFLRDNRLQVNNYHVINLTWQTSAP